MPDVDIMYAIDLTVIVLIYILSLLGIVGNVSNILVLRQHGFHDTTNIILISLSITDLFVSILFPISKLKNIISKFDLPLSMTVSTISSVVVMPLTSTMLSISILHSTLIAVERAVAVCFPFHIARIFTRSSTRYVIIGIYVVTFGLVSPQFLRKSVKWRFNDVLNATVAELVNTQFYQDNFSIINTYNWGVLNILFSVVTLSIIVICSFVIIIQLKRMKEKTIAKHKGANSKQNELKIFKTLLVVCVVTAIVWLPTCVIEMYITYASVSTLTSSLLHSTSVILYLISCSINFIIYVSTSSKFYNTFRALFCGV